MPRKNETEAKVVTFARHGRWLIPFTDADMKVLTKFNLRLTKWDVDYLSTMKLILSKRNYSVEIVPFKDNVLQPMFDKLIIFWSEKHKNKVTFDKDRFKLSAPNVPQNVQRLRTIESKLRTFFERWGFDVDITSNESKTKCGLTIEYSFSNECNPLITTNDSSHVVDFDPAILEMGNYRLLISQHGDKFGFSFEEKFYGNEWQPVKAQSNIAYDKLKSSRMISTLFEMFNKS